MSARQAEIHALRVAQEAAAHVPAYARFLRLAGYDASRLRSFAEFCALPTMDKPSYLTRYSLEQRCRRGDLARAHIVTLSSGSTGQPVLWPRFPEQDAVLQDGFMALEHPAQRGHQARHLVGVAGPERGVARRAGAQRNGLRPSEIAAPAALVEGVALQVRCFVDGRQAAEVGEGAQ